MVQKSLTPKFVNSCCKQYIIWEYPDILALKIIHEDLISFRNSCKFCQFFLYDFLGLKCPDTPKSYTSTIELYNDSK